MAHRSWYTGDATANTWVQDFSPLVMAPPLPGGDIALWPIIGKQADGTEPTKFEWIEEPLTPLVIAGNEGAGDGYCHATPTDTTWTMNTADCLAAGLRVGALLKNYTDKTKKEVVLVTAIDSVTAPADITVVRDYGGYVTGTVAAAGTMTGDATTGEVHLIGDSFEIIGYLNFQGSGVTSTDMFAKRDRSPKFNYYSILDDWTQVAAEDLVREYRGSSPDNWGYQLNGIKQRLDRQFERHLLHSPRIPVGASARSSMGGLLWMASKTSGVSTYSYVTTASTFNYELFDDGMKYLYNQGTLNGGADIVCLMPPAGVQCASYIHESAMRGEYISEQARGLRCTTLMATITGDRVPLVPVANMPSDSFMLLNLNACRVHFLQGMALNVLTKEVGEQLDMYRAARLYSNMTLEFHRPLDNSYFHTGVTYTRPT